MQKFIYLDESGCLGFDFSKKGTSKFFVVTFIETSLEEKTLDKIVKNCRNKDKKAKKTKEIKGTNSNIKIKERLIKSLFKKQDSIMVRSIVINKKKIKPDLRKYKRSCYSWIVGEILNETHVRKVKLIVDKRYTKPSFTEEFNYYLNQKYPNKFQIEHAYSHLKGGLQITDVLCHAIFQSFESKNNYLFDKFRYRTKLKCVF